MCAHVTLHFFSHRVKIEKQFGEDMLKLSRVMSGKDECGSLRRAWEQLKTGTGNCFKLSAILSSNFGSKKNCHSWTIYKPALCLNRDRNNWSTPSQLIPATE